VKKKRFSRRERVFSVAQEQAAAADSRNSPRPSISFSTRAARDFLVNQI